MYVQQVRQERKLVEGSDGRTRTVVEVVPEVDAQTLNHAGTDYPTHGNGVFHVPDDVGAEIVGGLFRNVTDEEGNVRAKPLHIDLAAAEKAKEPAQPAAVDPDVIAAYQTALRAAGHEADAEAVPYAAALSTEPPTASEAVQQEAREATVPNAAAKKVTPATKAAKKAQAAKKK